MIKRAGPMFEQERKVQTETKGRGDVCTEKPISGLLVTLDQDIKD